MGKRMRRPMPEQPRATLLDARTICRQPGRYIGWPTIARAPEGTLYVAFSGDRDAHVCPFGKTFLVRSDNGGATWTEPALINDTPLDDRDAGLCACRDGTLLVTWFTAHSDQRYLPPDAPPELSARWERKLASISEAELRRWTHVDFGVARGHWLRRSLDGGRTWGPPLPAPATAPHGPIELSDGRLLFVGNTGHDREHRTTAIVAAVSEDQGATWETLARIPMFPPYHGDAPDGLAYLAEPHVVEVAPARLVAMARHEARPYREGRTACVLWQFESQDGGHTWSAPRPTDILGKPPHLLKLHDGRLLVTYGYRHPPFGQRACLSDDGGVTWDIAHEIVLRDDGPSDDLGYPATAQLDDGTLVTVYYQAEHLGEQTALMMTRWRLEDV